MFNKLVYNPAYAGNKDVFCLNVDNRYQWVGINGAPRSFNISIDAPIKSPPVNRSSLGLGVSNERIGVVSYTGFKGYYAFRIFFERSTISLGVSGGVKLYSVNYGQLNPFNPNDPNATNNLRNKRLPNAGTGIFWKDAKDERFYLGFSIPNLIENRYYENTGANEIRGYYFSGGYIIPIKDKDGDNTVKLEPQLMVRYIKNDKYKLPVSTDINLSAIIRDKLMFGLTYRTDKSVEGIVHLQVLHNINIGYASDFLFSSLSPYSGWTHELMVGYDLPKGSAKYMSPRFIKSF